MKTYITVDVYSSRVDYDPGEHEKWHKLAYCAGHEFFWRKTSGTVKNGAERAVVLATQEMINQNLPADAHVHWYAKQRKAPETKAQRAAKNLTKRMF